MSIKKYRTIGLGGTFDHFHLGHQFFLDFAADLADHLKIGLTTIALTQPKILSESIQKFSERKSALESFLNEQEISAEIFELSDSFGPTLQPNFVEALAVTELTRSGGEAINQARLKKQFNPLPLHVSSLIKDESGQFISSTRIRQGIINREGKTYLNSLLNVGELSQSQKDQFKDKQGGIISQPTLVTPFCFVVGDIVLETFIQNQWPYTLGVFDGKTQRHNYTSPALIKISPDLQMDNSAGQILPELSSKISELLSSLVTSTLKIPYHIKIEGEEDLVAVCIAMLAPLGSSVYYGQPNEGIVEVIITEELKEKFRQVLAPARSS